MEKILKVYDYSGVDITRVSISEPKFSERYRYYYNYIRKVKKYSNYSGDTRLNYPGFLLNKDQHKSSILDLIKKFFGFKVKDKKPNEEEYTEEIYRNVIVNSCCQKDEEWVFDSAVNIYKEDEHFFINDEHISLDFGYSSTMNRVIFRFHDTNSDNINSDVDGSTWLELDEVYKVEVTKDRKDNHAVSIDTIYFSDREDLEEFLDHIQKYISKEDNIIIDDNTGKIIKDVVKV